MIKQFIRKFKDMYEKMRKNFSKKKALFKELWINSLYTYAYYHCKIKDNVAIIESRAGEDLAGNMYRIAQELVTRGYKVYITAKIKYSGKIEHLIAVGQLSGKVETLRMYSHKHYHVLATAKYLFCDTVFDWKYIKKDGQVYVNTWHGTPLKHLGYQVKGEQWLMGNGQRNLLMCDYIAMPSHYCADCLLDAYYLRNIFNGKVLYSGYPRNQIFFDSKSREIIRKDQNLSDKRVYVYMPTWRGTHTGRSGSSFDAQIRSMLEYLDVRLTADEVLFVRFHNFTKDSIGSVEAQFEHIRRFPDEYEPYEFLNCADCLITDYSSVFFDFANTGRKIVLYVPDKEEYISGRGMYFSIDELPFPQTFNVAELLEEIQNESYAPYPEFVRRFCEYDHSRATEKLLDYVLAGHPCCVTENTRTNDKKNVVIYSANIQMKNGIATAIMNLIKNLDTTKYNFYLAFYRKTTNASCVFFEEIPATVGIFSISSTIFFTIRERIAYHLQQKGKRSGYFVKKTLEKMYQRENKKLFFDAPFDVLVHFEGYGTNDTIPLFQYYPKCRVIWVHNDMVREIATKHNQHPALLQEAYLNYDKVAVVSPDIIEPTVKIGAPREKIFLVNNLHDADAVRERAKAGIMFEKDTEIRTYHPGGIKGVLDAKGKKFITIGRFSREKGHQRLLKAFDRFCNLYSDTQLIIIGGHGPLYNDTVKWAQQLRHWRNVTIIKSVRNPMPILKRCDLFILSSFYEGLGLVLLEADCLGVPTFSTDIVGPKMFMEKYHGHLVENSEKGILQGMYDFIDGKVHTLDIDYHEYNQKALREFYDICME